ATAPSAPPVPQAHVLVRLTSEPSGATVSADGKVYGQTPADIEWWGELAAQGRQITFEFAKDGFEKTTVVRELHGDSLNVEATLPSLQAETPRPPPTVRKKRRAKPEGTAAIPVPQSFKADPY
ncbi:MAG TPA: PEGA domain-containing protein, partial [Polyangiales bacterium]|nr:PEGA domain-containing protein [Polyangiales bacterium]